MRGLWLSINPRWIDSIVAGRKTVELRRRSPTVEPGAVALLYSTSPTSELVALARVHSVVQEPLESLWRRFGKAADVTPTEFADYFDGLTVGAAIQLESVERLVNPVELCELRRLGVEPAQGWRYLDAAMTEALLKSADARLAMSNRCQTDQGGRALHLQET